MESNRFILLVAGIAAAATASATITIPTVPVGDAGNANDGSGFGGVSYDYRIGTHEVTNAQYAAFLNSVAATDTHDLYDPNMGSDARGGISRGGAAGSHT